MDYQDIDGYTSLDSLVSKLNVTSNYISDTPLSIFVKNLVDYNRFKIKSSDDVLQKAFPHVFFVRPDLNLCYGDNKDLIFTILYSPLALVTEEPTIPVSIRISILALWLF